MNRANFMKDREGKIVALDFGATCFLPVCFFDLALCNPDPFTQRLRRLIVRSASMQLDALWLASRSLVPYGTNNIGKHISSLSLSLARRLKSVQVSRTSSGQRPRRYCARTVLAFVLASSCIVFSSLVFSSSRFFTCFPHSVMPSPSHTVRACRFADIYIHVCHESYELIGAMSHTTAQHLRHSTMPNARDQLINCGIGADCA